MSTDERPCEIVRKVRADLKGWKGVCYLKEKKF